MSVQPDPVFDPRTWAIADNDLDVATVATVRGMAVVYTVYQLENGMVCVTHRADGPPARTPTRVWNGEMPYPLALRRITDDIESDMGPS